ncbi:hypothetical protein ACS5PU_16365 [Pedobacter sp. GSP4]|uniref:hypothetical protein n=1 Tax=Pedobacter sp. GSP4 TaxID=3453716 RepID=UPI003EEAFCFC
MKKAAKKIEVLELKLGIKIKVDPALDNIAKLVPEKMDDSAAILANFKLGL